MEQQIRLQLFSLTSQHGLDESFVDRILAAMEKPMVTYTDNPVAQNETILSTVSVLERGILTVAMQIKGESDTKLAETNIDEIRADRELNLKLISLKREHDALQNCFWSTVRTRLEEEGVAAAGGNLGIRTNFQVVAIPSSEVGYSASIANLLTALSGNNIFALMSGTNARENIPSEILEKCPCDECKAELARRKVSEDCK